MIENMCQNEYHTSERAPGKKGMLKFDMHTPFLGEIEALSKQVTINALSHTNQTIVSQVHVLRCEFCGEGHAIGKCVLKEYTQEGNYADNFKKPNPYSNTYNTRLKDDPNFK